jgi:hypothetical protein
MPAPVASGWSESPGGACTHWKAPPCHGAPPILDVIGWIQRDKIEPFHLRYPTVKPPVALDAQIPLLKLEDLQSRTRDKLQTAKPNKSLKKAISTRSSTMKSPRISDDHLRSRHYCSRRRGAGSHAALPLPPP